MTEEQKQILKKFIGKKIAISYKVDRNYRVDGTPQFNPIVYVDGILSYDRYNDRENFTRKDWLALREYGKITEQVIKKANCMYGTWDFEYEFIVSNVILNLLN